MTSKPPTTKSARPPRPTTGLYAAPRPNTAAHARPQVRTGRSGPLPWQMALFMVALAAGTTVLTSWLLDRSRPTAAAHAETTSQLASAVHGAVTGPRLEDHPIQVPVRPTPSPEQLGRPLSVEWKKALGERLHNLPETPADPGGPFGTADWRSATPETVNRTSVTLRGIVRYPKTPGKHPLALLVHGNHGQCRGASGPDHCVAAPGEDCRPGEQSVDTPGGLVWAAESLAARGWIAEVIDGSFSQCFAGSEAVQARSELVLAHLRKWDGWQAGNASELDAAIVSQADLSRVALVGHSTGADAVMLAAARLQHPRVLGLHNVAVRGLALVAPPDYLKGPTPAIETGIIIATCDLDVYAMLGRHILDRADAAQPGTRMAMWLLGGGSHNAFNQSWRDEIDDAGFNNCDGAYRLHGETQRILLGRLLGDWLDATTSGAALPAWLMGQARPPVSGDIDLRTVLLPGGRRQPEAQTVEGHGLQNLTKCQGAVCPVGVTRKEPTWVASWTGRGGSLTWAWLPSDPGPATHGLLRVAALPGSPRDRPLRLGAAWLDAHGHEVGTTTVEILPPLDQSAEIDGVGTRPWPLGQVLVALPTGTARREIAGLRLHMSDGAEGSIAVGEVVLASLSR